MDTPQSTATGAAPLEDILARLDVITEEQFCLLFDVTPNTAEAWRKRRTGPPFIRFGKRYLYPIAGLRESLHKRVREPVAPQVHVL